MTTEEYITTVEGKEYITTDKIFQWQSDYWSGVVESEVVFFHLLNSPLLRYMLDCCLRQKLILTLTLTLRLLDDGSGPPGINGMLITTVNVMSFLLCQVLCYVGSSFLQYVGGKLFKTSLFINHASSLIIIPHFILLFLSSYIS